MIDNLEMRQLEILDARIPNLETSNKRQLYRLQSGVKGENLFLEMVHKYGHPNWKIYSDYWFSYGKRLQADFILVTSNRWLVVEVKHYDGLFEYIDNECYLNGHLLSDNYLATMDLRVRHLRHMAHEINKDIIVDGLFTFMHEFSEININQSFDFGIKLRNQLKRYLTNLKNTDKKPLDLNYVTDIELVLQKYSAGSPFLPKAIANETWNRLTKGINCAKCGSFTTISKLKTIRCSNCNFKESKLEAVERMIEQLELLYFDSDEPITAPKIYEFCGNQITLNGVYRILALYNDTHKNDN